MKSLGITLLAVLGALAGPSVAEAQFLHRTTTYYYQQQGTIAAQQAQLQAQQAQIAVLQAIQSQQNVAVQSGPQIVYHYHMWMNGLNVNGPTTPIITPQTPAPQQGPIIVNPNPLPQTAPTNPIIVLPQQQPAAPSNPIFTPQAPGTPQFTPQGPGTPIFTPQAPGTPIFQPQGPGTPQFVPVSPGLQLAPPGVPAKTLAKTLQRYTTK